jgi:transposase
VWRTGTSLVSWRGLPPGPVVVEPHLREAPVFVERTCVGLDVHARSVVACAIDSEAGEIRSLRLSPKTEAVVEWVRSLPAPVAVTYEAGPTGFGLARALQVVGVRCVVVAPPKIERSPGDT